ncbi:PucR family transcriptional regulator [Streptomyces sp. M54]|uniref:PucR family transcriptional regulator n=1 Tax=Streptomyces sp. M54 TaxID=2759525 RepID=UPI001A9014CC|nr:PucR family transcriptional regulator [Streptomyces sp. M54]QSS90858.1 PucR family transcriptional regulator [Streptomyces sp. M54]
MTLPPPPPTDATAPTAPPTPPVALSELLAREELGLRRIAGPADAELLWVHTSEMADPYPYLLGGELLLTAGVLLTDPDHYVSRLVEAGASALGFGVRPVHEAVPRGLVEACDRQGLPLLEVGPQTPFTAIARAVWRLMAEARHRELRRVTRAQQALATAAARPDPVPAVLQQLASQLGGRAALLTAAGDEVRAAGREVAPEAAAALTRLAGVVARARPGSPTSATDAHGDTRLSAYALGGGEDLALALATRRRGPGDHTVAGVAVVLLSLLTAPHQDADAANRSAALVRLLLGAPPAEVAPLLDGGEADSDSGPDPGCHSRADSALSSDPGPGSGSGSGSGSWRVVHARRTDGAPADALTAGALGASLSTALLDAGGGSDAPVRLLLPYREDAAPLTARPGWTLGASAPVPVTDLGAADSLAARALAHARATRVPLAVDAPASGLAALVPPERAAAHARALLAPLTAPLADTLRCWLSLHGSWDRTAVALGVHRNTVRQRIRRCGALLGKDLDDMDVRTELWFALRQR